MRFILSIFLFFLAPLPMVAQVYHLVPSESSTAFTIKNFGLTVAGHFGPLTGSGVFVPTESSQCKFRVALAVSTLQTGIGLRDEHLQGEDYFDSQRHPLITFESTDSQLDEATRLGHLSGKLQIKGVTKQVVIPFTYQSQHDTVHLVGKLTLNRRDFNVGKNSFSLADEVHIEIRVPALLQKTTNAGR